jgi:hypothetical protein
MQLQNASTNGGSFIPLSANVTWVAPHLPGGPGNNLLYEFAACVPSNVDLASTCCSTVKGQFIKQDLANSTSIDDAEVRAIYEKKYPNQNLTIPTSVQHGTLINATGAGEKGAINWCSMIYNPLSGTALDGAGYYSGGGLLGNIPESVQDWIKCFENNTSAEARAKNEVAYECVALDVSTGGRIVGINSTFMSDSAKDTNGGSRGEPTRWIGLLGVAVMAGLWTVCV